VYAQLVVIWALAHLRYKRPMAEKRQLKNIEQIKYFFGSHSVPNNCPNHFSQPQKNVWAVFWAIVFRPVNSFPPTLSIY